MDRSTIVIVGVTALLGIICGWLVPILFKSQRPFGVLGDILVCTVAAVALAYVEWTWMLEAIGFRKEGWIAIMAAIGDPLGLGLICLWLIRKLKK